MCATGRSLVDTLLAVREAVPHHSLQAVADRWAIMCLVDGLWCPGPSDFDVAIRAARRRTEPPSRFAARHASRKTTHTSHFCGSFHRLNLKKTGPI
jgi:hypothetical protein